MPAAHHNLTLAEAELALLRYYIPEDCKYAWDYFIQDQIDRAAENRINKQHMNELTQPRISNTIVFLSRVPTQGVQEAAELVSLVHFYESLREKPEVPAGTPLTDKEWEENGLPVSHAKPEEELDIDE